MTNGLRLREGIATSGTVSLPFGPCLLSWQDIGCSRAWENVRSSVGIPGKNVRGEPQGSDKTRCKTRARYGGRERDGTLAFAGAIWMPRRHVLAGFVLVPCWVPVPKIPSDQPRGRRRNLGSRLLGRAPSSRIGRLAKIRGRCSSVVLILDA